MTKSIFSTCIITALLGVSSISAQAQTIVNNWSSSGGAWTAANQPDFVAAPGGGGTLYSDEAIAGGTNNGTDNTGAIWTSVIPPFTFPPGPGSGIYGGYYYTLASTPAISINTTNLLADVQTITFSLNTAATFVSNSVTLNFSGALAANDFSAQYLGDDPDFGAGIYIYTWTWDVSGATLPSSFSVDWTTPAQHTAYFSAQLIQAVPEPSTYAMIALAMGVLVVFHYRRRRAVA